ncbi:unannotated protein [freshwater metagenome]|uniref:Unannotated protein n=1 Tax=freshwater metagenome TaxID=449393 RepID=A0A6J7AFV8_9ZZZZ
MSAFVMSAVTNETSKFAVVESAGGANASAKISSFIDWLSSFPESASLWASFCPTIPPPPMMSIFIYLVYWVK